MDEVWGVQETAELSIQPVKNISFYGVVDRLWNKAITAKWPLHRFLSLVRLMGVTHFTEEDISLTSSQPAQSSGIAELEYEIEALAARTSTTPASLKPRIKRCTFFWTRDGDNLSSVKDEAVAGYFVHISAELPNGKRIAYIFDAVLRKPLIGSIDATGKLSLQPVNRFLYLHCSSDFTTLCGRGPSARAFTIHGTFFTQQNLVTHVCAHAALRIGINSSKNLTGDRRLTNQAINSVLGIDHKTPSTRVGTYHLTGGSSDPVTRGRGLSSDEMKEVLTSPKLGLNVDCTLLNCKQMAETEFDHFMYPYVESGWPALVGLEGTNVKNGKQVDHVLCALGHTLDPFHWSPEARQGYGMMPRSEIMPAVEWTDHFVINDDGYGMHMTLQSDVVRNFINPSRNASLHVMFVMALRPKSVEYDGSNSTRVAATTLKNWYVELKRERAFVASEWHTRLVESPEIVCRTMYMTRGVYIDALLKGVSGYHDKIRNLLGKLPDAFWLTEVTLPPLYAGNGRKLGDVIIRVDDPMVPGTAGRLRKRTAKEVLDSQWEFIWLPGAAQFRNGALLHWPIVEPIEMIGASGSLSE